MKIIGSVRKESLKDGPVFGSLVGSKWESIVFSNENVELQLYYDPASNIRVINNNNVLISDDKLFVIENGFQKRLEDPDLVKMIENESIDFIKHIQPNVNVALFDKLNNRIYLASNRATAGRMYYTILNGTLYFSNNFVILTHLRGPLSLNNMALYAYCKFGAVPEDITFDKEIKSVPVGHYASIRYDTWEVEYVPYFQFDYNNSAEKEISDSMLSSVDSALKVNAKALSNEQVHMLISGGIDSSLFAFYLKEYTSNIIGHYCRFGEHDPEQKYAEVVANSLDIPLKIHTLYDENIIHEIEDTASNTSYPHNDYSNVSVNFLLRKIKEEFGAGAIVIDCNGADDGFGYNALKKIPIWQNLYKIPNALLTLLGEFATIGDTWMYDSAIRRKLFYLYRAKEKDIYISHMIGSAGAKIMNVSNHYDKALQEMVTLFFNNNIANDHPSDYEKMNVAQFYHINSRHWTAKGCTPADSLNLKIVYPFTWRNILEIQCKVPLNTKIFNNHVKWPLKKLLENYMEKDFIYRKKSGFAPPLVRWLNNKDVYNYIYKSVMDGLVIDMFQRNKIDKIFKLIKQNKRISRYALNFIWSLLFLDVWLKKNNINNVK